MTKQAKQDRTKPFSIRLTNDELTSLQSKAGGVPLGTFIRSAILGNDLPAGMVRRQTPVKDAEALGQILGLLGQSRLANNLNQLAKAANMGSLPVSEEVEADIRRACAEIFDMRRLLLTALGMQILNSVKDVPALSETFAESAGGSQ